MSLSNVNQRYRRAAALGTVRERLREASFVAKQLALVLSYRFSPDDLGAIEARCEAALASLDEALASYRALPKDPP